MKTNNVMVVAAVVVSLTSQALADRGTYLGKVGRGTPAPVRIPSPTATPSKSPVAPAPLPSPQPRPVSPTVQSTQPVKIASPSPVVSPTKPPAIQTTKPTSSSNSLKDDFRKAQYPPNNGASGKEKIVMGQPGQTFSRRGTVEGPKSTDIRTEALNGTYASPKGTMIPERALKGDHAKSKDVVFSLIKPTAYFETRVTPAFGMPGGGLQARFPKKLDTMLPTSQKPGSIKLLGHGDKGYLTETVNLRASEMAPNRAHELFKGWSADWRLRLKAPVVLK